MAHRLAEGHGPRAEGKEGGALGFYALELKLSGKRLRDDIE
jgi:hypothetical protein